MSGNPDNLNNPALNKGPVIKTGHLKIYKKDTKEKKKKFFVLRDKGSNCPSCLDYYDKKKCLKLHASPKQSISLQNCLSVNKDKKNKPKFMITLDYHDDSFYLICENQKDLDDWFDCLVSIINSKDNVEEIQEIQEIQEVPQPNNDSSWEVYVEETGIGEQQKDIVGHYKLCISNRVLYLFRLGNTDKCDFIKFPISCIRSSGTQKGSFFIEVGRSAETGEGIIIMTPKNILNLFNIKIALENLSNSPTIQKDKTCPKQRIRSASANETSKPISFMQKCSGQKFPYLDSNGRERCDSLPSRTRTMSDNIVTSASISQPKNIHSYSQLPRSFSLQSRGSSYSPPVSTILTSPSSAMYSTDSAGSSLSMDESSDNIYEESLHNKYGNSLTPDEPVILEENGEEYVPWSANQSKFSPSFKNNSPYQPSSYVEMCGSWNSSSGQSGYMQMSPATVNSHSRSSSFAEDNNNTLPDGYVPMAPINNAGYVDMDPTNVNYNENSTDNGSHYTDSNCSVTSGTPSTDTRFSEYHLDKVTSFFGPGDDIQLLRTTRAYSVGSKPEPIIRHRKNSRPDLLSQEMPSRVRAFSVGSHSKQPENRKFTNVVTAPFASCTEKIHSTKSNSAPVLSNSWIHSSGSSNYSKESMSDLVEIDFSKQKVSVKPSTTISTSSFACDTSSYVDMNSGHSLLKNSEKNNPLKLKRNNNNNSITAANHNHNHVHSLMIGSNHKPITSMLKTVKETECAQLEEKTSNAKHNIKVNSNQFSKSIKEDISETDGPCSGTKTSPMDFPFPRKPPDGYVEMSFKTKANKLEQDYMNMCTRNIHNNRKQYLNINRKKYCSQPIEIQAGMKTSNTADLFPFTGENQITENFTSTSGSSESQAGLSGSSSLIFPLSLKNTQLPKSSMLQVNSGKSFSINDVSLTNNDYVVMVPTRKISAPNPLQSADSCPYVNKTIDNKISPVIDTDPKCSTDQKNLKHKLSNLTLSSLPETKTSYDLDNSEKSNQETIKINEGKLVSTTSLTHKTLCSQDLQKLQPSASFVH